MVVFWSAPRNKIAGTLSGTKNAALPQYRTAWSRAHCSSRFRTVAAPPYQQVKIVCLGHQQDTIRGHIIAQTAMQQIGAVATHLTKTVRWCRAGIRLWLHVVPMLMHWGCRSCGPCAFTRCCICKSSVLSFSRRSCVQQRSGYTHFSIGSCLPASETAKVDAHCLRSILGSAGWMSYVPADMPAGTHAAEACKLSFSPRS